MAKSFSIFQLMSFVPEDQSDFIEAPRNRALPNIVEEPPRTELTLDGPIGDLGFDQYRALHEFYVSDVGRAETTTFTRYIRITNFPVFYHKQLSLLLIQARKDVAKSTVKQLFRIPAIKGGARSVNLQSIMDHINRLTGAWWDVENSANVNSQALYGRHIDLDERFVRASSEGNIFNVRFDHEYDGGLYPVGLSDDCNVVIYSEGLSIDRELEIVLDIKTRLLDIARPK